MTVSLLYLPALAADVDFPSGGSVVPAQFGAVERPPYVAFDDTTQEEAVFYGPIPSHYNPGDPLSVIMEWRTPTLQASSGRAVFDVSIVAVPPNYFQYDSAFANYGTPVEVEIAPDAALPTGPGTIIDSGRKSQFAHFDFLTSGEINGIQPNQTLLIRVRRLPGDAADDHSGDIEVLGLHVVTDLFDPATWDPTIGVTLQWYHDIRDFSSLGFSGSEVDSVLDQTTNNIDLTPINKGPEYDPTGCGSRPALVYDDDDLGSAAQGLVTGEADWTYVCVWQQYGTSGSVIDIAKLVDVFDLESNANLEQTNIEDRTPTGNGENSTVFSTIRNTPIISIVWYNSSLDYIGYRINGGAPEFALTIGPSSSNKVFQIGNFDGGDFYFGVGFMYLKLLTFEEMNEIFIRLAQEWNIPFLTAPLATGPVTPP